MTDVDQSTPTNPTSPTVAAKPVDRLAFAGLFGGLFTGYVGLTAAIPVLPVFVRDRFDASNVVVGLVVTATALTALLTRPVAGTLADRYGYRLIMRTGSLLLAAAAALYFLPLGLPALVGVRLLLGIGEAALFTAGAVWVVSLTPPQRRGQLIGLYGLSMWAGISLGTFLGAALLPLGYAAVWALCAGAPLVGVVLVSLVPAPTHTPPPAGSRLANLLPRPALLPGIALGLAASGYAGLAAFVVLHLQARHISAAVAVLSCFSAVYAGTRLVIGHFPDKYGPRRVVIWSGIGEAVGLLVIALAPNLPIAVAGSVVMGVGFSLLHPSLALMVMNRTDPAKQGAAIGAYTSFWDVGLTVFGPLMGLVATGFGYPAVFVVGAACAVSAVLVSLAVRQQRAVTA